MTASELANTIRSIIPDASVEVEDLTGTEDHFRVMVVSAQFTGKSRVDRHKMVFEPLQKYFSSNEIHALTLKTYTPDQIQG